MLITKHLLTHSFPARQGESITLLQFRALLGETGKQSWTDLLDRGRNGQKVGGSVDTQLGTARWSERGDRSVAASLEPHKRHGHGEWPESIRFSLKQNKLIEVKLKHHL